MEARWILLSAVGAVLVWWLANALATVASKRFMLKDVGAPIPSSSCNEGSPPATWTAAFTDLRWVDLTAMQHAVGSVLSVAVLKVTGRVVWPDNASSMLRVMCMAAVGNLAGNMATNAAYALISSSTAQVVKACEPLFTFMLSVFLYKNYSNLDLSTFLSVVIVVTGAVSFIKGDSTFTLWGLLAGMISNLAFPIRNIYLKNLSSMWDSPLQKFAVMSVLSTLFVLPLVGVKLVMCWSLPALASKDSLVSSTFHGIYNMASITVLESFSPVTHAVLNLTKRVFVITANLFYFNEPTSLSLVISLGLLLSGCYLYHLSRSRNMRFIPLKIIILFIYMLYSMTSSSISLMSVKQPTNTCCDDQERVSTSWVYEQHLPDQLLANIRMLSERNPGVDVHVYCGSLDCMQKVSGLEKGNVVLEFLVVPDILRDTPLEGWAARHAINKILTGREFEKHLDDVVRLGLLWQYGGVYVDPAVQVTTTLKCMMGKTPWIALGKGLLDAAYFPKSHSFIENMMQLYDNHYRRFNTSNLLLRLLKDKSCNDCPDHFTDDVFKRVDWRSSSLEKHHYGTLCYDVRVLIAVEVNLGDEVQGFPGAQFLPFVDTFLERDRLNTMMSPSSPQVTAFFNAWWGAGDASWPPASNIHPIMVSVHIGDSMQYHWSRSISYLDDKQPIGCRDHSTLDFLLQHHVNAYFSGCMTLMMRNPNIHGKRTGKTYVVDVAEDVLSLIPEKIRSTAFNISHAYGGADRYKNLVRFTKAYKHIEEYGSAKLVITQRIHTALPCVAMGTPVIFIDHPGVWGATGGKSSPRTAGLTPMFHTLSLFTKSVAEATQWLQDFPWDNPPPNPNFGLKMRLRSTLWNAIRQHQPLRDAAQKFGLLPLTQLTAVESEGSLTFHLVLGSSPTLSWREWRCVESVFHHHPAASLTVHSNTLPQQELDVLTEAGYHVTVQPYHLEHLLEASPAKAFLPTLPQAREGSDWLRRERELVGLLALYAGGGVYLDPEVVLVRPVDTLPTSTMGYADETNSTVHSAFIKMEKDSPYLHACLEAYGGSDLQPDVMTRVWQQAVISKDNLGMHMMPYQAFNMLHQKQEQCFQETRGPEFETNSNILSHHAYAVTITSSFTSSIDSKIKRGTICSKILNVNCVLCNIMH